MHHNKELKKADIFHLYDTGEECFKDNSGYHDSRHFNLIAFNSETMEKHNLGRHDGIFNHGNDVRVVIMRVFADGSFFVRLEKPATIGDYQCVYLY